MLILTREREEGIMIGDDIHIILLSVKGKFARFGVEAPRDIEIHRDEIYQRILLERQKQKITYKPANKILLPLDSFI